MGSKNVPKGFQIANFVGTFCPHNVGFISTHTHTQFETAEPT